MKKLRVIAVRDRRDELMLALQRLGCVEVHEPKGMLADEDAAALLRPEQARLTTLRTELMGMQSAVRVLDRYAPAKKKLLSARPTVSEADFLDGDALADDMTLAAQLGEWDARIRRITADEAKLLSDIEALSPWLALDMELNGAGTKTCGTALFSALAQIDMTAVQDAAAGASEAVELIRVSDDEQQHCFVVIALRNELPAVSDALRAIGCTQVSFPGLRGTAKENIDRLDGELAALTAERESLEEDIRAQAGMADALRLSCDRLAAETAKAEATERLCGTDSVVALEGWLPAE